MQWRGVSIAKLGQLTIAPFLVEAMSAVLFTWMFLRAVSMGVDPARQMLIAVAGSAGYGLSAFIAGRWVTPRIAPQLLVGAILTVMALGLGAVAIDQFGAFVIISALVGMVIGHYYVPFMINMGHVRPFKTMAWSVACFNLSWGVGISLGSFYSAWFKNQGTAIIVGMVIGLAAVHTAVSLIAQFAPRVEHDQPPHAAFASTIAQRISSRICLFCGAMVMRGLYSTLWPYLCKAQQWSDHVTAVGWFAIYINVPLWALTMARLRKRLLGPGFMIGAMLIGAGAFAMLGVAEAPWQALICMAGVGVMEGVVVYHALYYANTDKDQPGRSIAWIETLTGTAYLLGPMAFGLIAFDTQGALALRTYLPGSGLILIAALTVVVMWRRAGKPTRSPADRS